MSEKPVKIEARVDILRCPACRSRFAALVKSGGAYCVCGKRYIIRRGQWYRHEVKTFLALKAEVKS